MGIFPVFILFLLLATSCKDNPTDTEKSDIISVKGFIFDVFDNDTMLVPEVQININDQTYISDDSGNFLIDEVPAGPNEFAFNTEYHKSLDTVLVFQNTSPTDSFEIELIPLQLDILPLEVGNKWVYKVESKDNLSKEVGTEEIEVVDLMDEHEAFAYKVLRSISGYNVNNEDTTYFEEEGYFLVKENKITSEITTDFSGSPSFEVFFGPVGPLFESIYIGKSEGFYNSYTMRRFIPYSRVNNHAGLHTELQEGHYGVTSIWTPFYSVVVDTGNVYYEEEWSGHTSNGYYKKDLVSFTKQGN